MPVAGGHAPSVQGGLTDNVRMKNREKTRLVHKETKLPPHCSTKTPKRYKRNAINGNLHRAKTISSEFDHEIIKIRNKFLLAGYPEKFINSTIKSFHERAKEKENENTRYEEVDDNEFIIPPFLFEESKQQLYVELPFCFQNEKISKTFMKKFHEFTRNRYMLKIKWITRKVRTLFRLKDNNPHPSCVIYKGTCSCGVDYIGETKRNSEVRWDEHNDVNGKSESAKQLRNNQSHKFDWKILSRAPQRYKDRINLESYFIALQKPSLNNQIDSKALILFRNGIT